MKNLFLTVVLLLVINSCKKDETYPTYTGEVRQQTNDCIGSTGYPLIIKVYNNTQYDSVYTLTLPSQYWVIGKKLSFKMRPIQNGDEPMLCSATVIGAKQVIVFDVTNQ
jgi:hypothetical protein